MIDLSISVVSSDCTLIAIILTMNVVYFAVTKSAISLLAVDHNNFQWILEICVVRTIRIIQ